MDSTLLDIAVGRSRHAKTWQNQQITWEALLDRFSETHRTAESFTEYLTANKTRQDEIKDVGGFVGGYLAGGRRKKDAVLNRQLLTLDLDFANTSFWEDFTLLYGCAAALYTTHKHSPESPRYRLIIPLATPIAPDQYEAIARRIAGDTGIELFDPSTFQAERLMYWPSTARDGVYEFKKQDGPWLDVDSVLSAYRDWKDTSEWPVTAKIGEIIKRGIKQQGDPLVKTGIVGAFCRSFDIHQAIDHFLTDEYEHCDIEGRYTYRKGSTAAGLITYDDKFAYSHHGTDPTGDKLCNAFDLVRLHKFGLKDENTDPHTPINRKPSFVAMLDFASSQPEVRALLASERLETAQYDFAAGVLEESTTEEKQNPQEPESKDWLKDLETDRKGNSLSTHANIKLILENDKRLRGCFAYDAFKNRKWVIRSLPWRKIGRGGDQFLDTDEQNLTIYLATLYNILNRANTKDVLDAYIMANQFHPVKEYLEAQVWDGTERLDMLLTDYLGAEDTYYTRQIIRKTLCAAVARIFRPGIKFDNVLTFIGPEGTGKSSFIAALGRQWFSDSFSFHMLSKGDKAYEQIQGFWIIEIGELGGLRKAELESVKHFIAKREDSWRGAYKHNVETAPRQSIFMATGNDPEPLRGVDGNRRWWMVDVNPQAAKKDIFRDLGPNEVNQIWAEAVQAWQAGETLYLDKETEGEAREIQKQYTEKDERRTPIMKYLETPIPANWEQMSLNDRRTFLRSDSTDILAPSEDNLMQRQTVTIAEIWCELFGGMERDMTSVNTKPLHQIMRTIPGWSSSNSQKRTALYGKQRCYERL